jgi:hypothetical protein
VNHATDFAKKVFDLLWEHYIALMPSAQKALAIVRQQGDAFINDHIAFRSFGYPHTGIAMLEKIFFKLGYQKMDYINFAEKKLNAHWYKPADLTLPKVFISEIRVPELSAAAQEIITRYASLAPGDAAKNISPDDPASFASVLKLRPWPKPLYLDYESLLKESEYAAWVLAFGNASNHFTIQVNALNHIKDIAALNALLEQNGLRLNDAGGKIKGTPESLLMQSSTVADKLSYEFSDQKAAIPYSYLEFAQRFLLPEYASRHPELTAGARVPYSAFEHCYQGFIEKNADKIFESTYTQQANKLEQASRG